MKRVLFSVLLAVGLCGPASADTTELLDLEAESGIALACEFNETDYLTLNPDVLAAVRRGIYRSGYDHYVRYGQYENRQINRYCRDRDGRGGGRDGGRCEFNERDYLSLNPDVLAAVRRGTFRSGYEHYIQHGQYEGRRINRDCGRDGRGDRDGRDGRDGRGDRDGRDDRGNRCAFDERDYLMLNPDVASAVRRGIYRSGYEHYLHYGRYERRQINRRCR